MGPKTGMGSNSGRGSNSELYGIYNGVAPVPRALKSTPYGNYGGSGGIFRNSLTNIAD